MSRIGVLGISAALIFQLAAFFLMPISARGTGQGSCSPLFPDISLQGGQWYREVTSISAVPTEISAQSAVLIRCDTGEILYEHNAHAVLPMASTTKIMTALLALECLSPTASVTIPREAVGVEGSSIYLTEGERLTLEELLYALMLSSANDAAEAIALACAGSVAAFAELMNQKALSLGLTHTHFTNPHGLDHPDHHTTALELAQITRSALSQPLLSTIMSTRRKIISHNGSEGIRLLVNHNKLLSSYEGAVGVKTGFTKKSGRCLVSAATREGVTLIAVTLNAPDDWRDHTALLDYGFSLYEQVVLCPVGAFEAPLSVVGGDTPYIMGKNSDALILTLPKTRGRLLCVLALPRFIYAPVSCGQRLGSLRIYEERSDGTLVELGQCEITACHDVNALKCEPSLLEKIADFFGF